MMPQLRDWPTDRQDTQGNALFLRLPLAVCFLQVAPPRTTYHRSSGSLVRQWLLSTSILSVIAGYALLLGVNARFGSSQRTQSHQRLVAALRDPYSGNLDRIQIVKVWIEASGEQREKGFDVVWSGDRVLDANGKLTAVGNTVDVANATWTNSIGSPELIAAWTDPEFDASVSAAYYARVLEIPTPPWYAYDAFRFGIEIPEGAPTSQQERAYTSPIWYTP